MRLFISIIILGMILFLLAYSFQYHAGESVSEFDEAGAALTGAGAQIEDETKEQMQNRENVFESQEEGTTVLDLAVDSAKEEAEKWDESSLNLWQKIWDDTKKSAYKMASDTGALIYPPKPKAQPTNKLTPQTAQGTQNE